jgi:hypothetical protein
MNKVPQNISYKKYDSAILDSIYAKTGGYCHLCHKKLSRVNYGNSSGKGAWHVEHSLAKASGGTNHLNNLFAACISCNIEKGTRSARSVRMSKGKTGVPMSVAQRKRAQAKEDNTVTGILAGGLLGLRFGAFGALVGGIVGGIIGSES